MPKIELKNGDDHAYNQLETMLDQVRRKAAGETREWNCTLLKTPAMTSFTIDIRATPEELKAAALQDPAKAE